MNRRSVATVNFGHKNPASAGSLRWLSVSSDIMKEVILYSSTLSMRKYRSITYNLLCSPLRLPHGILHKTKEVGVLEIIVLVLGIACCALYAELVALKKKVQALDHPYEIDAKIERLTEENTHLKNSIRTLTDDNYKLSNALAKWEIVSYERMTDMIFSSYMATK
ncbi:hypothetical protein, partial [Salmonella enterica]